MRDSLFLLCFPFFIYYGLRAPVVGLCLWFWTSMYPMQNWLYGFGLDLRINLVFSLITIASYFFMKNKPEYRITGLFVLVVMFCLQSSLGLMFYSVYEFQWESFSNFAKGIVFFLFCTLLIRKKQHFEAVLAFLCLALCFYGFMEALKYISTGGGHKIIGIQGPLGDNNKVALGLNMSIPLMLYMASEIKNIRIKQFFWTIIIGCIIAVLATASRGGLLALLFMGVYYWWTTGKKFSIIFVVIIVIAIVAPLLPDAWFERMDTIQSADSDGSFLSRVTFWKINFLAALDHPFTGMGFNTTAIQSIWQAYVPDLDSLNFFFETPVPEIGFVAHSIYFEVLGNQGLLGFVLFILMLLTAIRNINQMLTHFEKIEWEYRLLKAIKISLLTFCVGGAALNAAYFELLYLLFAMIICLKISVDVNKQPIGRRFVK
ncbi:putative O-glycosylation ligase, exosortase A system-associated [Flavobacterium sp. W21_SRS_FM6]|uniref:putative O-glycosylation ligase, exosortase A system-associated n=1 Tax=Flavobacterium sp. W21_SRS_FM6 TaxID=3240268 RepID=UPI003F90EB0D